MDARARVDSVVALGGVDADQVAGAFEVAADDLDPVFPARDVHQVAVPPVLPVDAAALGARHGGALQLPAVEGLAVHGVLHDDPVAAELVGSPLAASLVEARAPRHDEGEQNEKSTFTKHLYNLRAVFSNANIIAFILCWVNDAPIDFSIEKGSVQRSVQCAGKAESILLLYAGSLCTLSSVGRALD